MIPERSRQRSGSEVFHRTPGKIGRYAVGVEIDENHCETAYFRLAQNMLPYSPPLTPEQLSLLDIIEPLLEEEPIQLGLL